LAIIAKDRRKTADRIAKGMPWRHTTA